MAGFDAVRLIGGGRRVRVKVAMSSWLQSTITSVEIHLGQRSPRLHPDIVGDRRSGLCVTEVPLQPVQYTDISITQSGIQATLARPRPRHLCGDGTIVTDTDVLAGAAPVFRVTVTRSLQLQALERHGDMVPVSAHLG